MCDDDGWDLNDGQAVCNALSLGNVLTATQSGFYEQGSDTVWPTNFDCVGTELNIGNCLHLGKEIENCSASVKCIAGNFLNQKIL